LTFKPPLFHFVRESLGSCKTKGCCGNRGASNKKALSRFALVNPYRANVANMVSS